VLVTSVLVHEPVLDVDASRTGAREVADEFLERRRRLVGILSDDIEKSFCLALETGCNNLLSVPI